MVTYHDVLLETTEKIATVTLNRPKARNAFKASSIYKGINSNRVLRGEWCNSSHHETCSVSDSPA